MLEENFKYLDCIYSNETIVNRCHTREEEDKDEIVARYTHRFYLFSSNSNLISKDENNNLIKAYNAIARLIILNKELTNNEQEFIVLSKALEIIADEIMAHIEFNEKTSECKFKETK